MDLMVLHMNFVVSTFLMNIHTFILQQLMKVEARNLKENKEEFMGGFGKGKGKE